MDVRVVSRSLVEQIRDVLREEIVTLALAPGEKLTVESLAQRFGVSRTPIRDALNLLVEEGLVVVAPRVGYYVVKLSLDDIEEISGIRKMIELYALGLAMRNIQPGDVAALLEDTRATQSLRGAERREAFGRVDRRFHSDIIRMAGNKRLVDLSARIHAFVDLMRNLNVRVDEALEEHIAILEAVRRGDSAAAHRLLEAHLDAVRSAVIDALSKDSVVLSGVGRER